MTNTSAYPPKLVSRARQVYLLLAGLFAAGVVLQVFFAGLGVLVDPGYFDWHTTFAHLLELILLVMPVVGLVGRVGWRGFGLNALLFILFGMQYFFMYGLQGPLRALHVVNALVLFWLSVQLAQRSWKSTREAQSVQGVAGRSVRRRGLRVGRQLAGVVAVLAGAVVLFGVVFDNGPGSIGSGRAPQGEPTQVASRPAPSVLVKGDDLFSRHCAGCHGQEGGGGFGPALSGNDRLADKDAVVEQILDGGGGMPAFGNQSDEEVAAVATYIRTHWGNNLGPITAADVAGQR